MEKATYDELRDALRDALAALEKASPALAADWPAQEQAEATARDVLTRAI